ncbi:MAG: MerR family transcriptional regulator [Eubacteriales bacterium]|nr:MerR family transcriptional regulator [Eubacteriales bacterium]
MTIKQVCQRYGLTQDTLRYYEKIGVIPPVHRSASGIRDYDEHDLGWVENAVCLRNAGVPVESIAEYVKLYQAGDETFAARRDLLSHVLADLTEQRSQLDAAIQKLTYKVSRYEAAVRTGVLSWTKETETD